MPYIDATKAKQIVSIAKDYIGTTYYSYVAREANGFGHKNDWSKLLCFYTLFREAKHRIDDLINDPSYQSIILKLLSKVALTPNYTLATCGTNVLVVSGGCGCGGASSTTGTVSGCTDSIVAFHMNFGDTVYTNPQLVGVTVLIAIREGIVMRANPSASDGYNVNDLIGTFTPNAPISEQGEDFILLVKNCNSGGGQPIPPINLPDPIEFIVAQGSGPAAGTTIYTNPVLANRFIYLERQGLEQTTIGYPNGEGYTQPNNAGTISVAPAWVDGETVKIKAYK